MVSIKFKKYLLDLGYSPDQISQQLENSTFTYMLDVGVNRMYINYVYSRTEDQIFSTHLEYWNRNDVNVFISVGDDKTYILNAKEKPDKFLSEKVKIHTFNYGVNTTGFEKEKVREISKEFIDASYFFEFVSKKKKSIHTVDKDLLLNLIKLKSDLLSDNNEDIIHLLILRCLFIKYLEDNGIYNAGTLVNILKTNDPQKLIQAFDEIKKINGDIFKYDKFKSTDLKPYYLSKLHQFFSSDYRTKQLPLFPYQFNRIPIQLISHVYEAFLKSEPKKQKGIFYTPSFIVNFMLFHTIGKKLESKKDITILDPAVGSGAFLVECFRMILRAYSGNIDFYKKKEILQNQLFGIDIDRQALQIATFSLYLALIETEKPEFIRQQIKNSHPILPSLIGKNLIEANALIDDVFKNKTFDFIVSNPPWGSVKDTEDHENLKERTAIESKGKIGTIPDYKNVSDYERAQAFLLLVKKWCNDNTVCSMIVKNSLFLNDNAIDFRQDLLSHYQVDYFYELSNYNKILFKKRIIGKINEKRIEVGATEPCAILVFKLSRHEESIVNYISPKLTNFSENFECIHYTQKDIKKIEQSRFLYDDLLWRVLVNGDLEDYKLIKKKLLFENGIDIECRSGFQPQKKMQPLGEPVYKDLITPQDFRRYFITNRLDKFNWNQKLHRKRNEKIFRGTRILIPVRPLKSDEFRFRGVNIEREVIHKDNILAIKIKDNNKYFENIAPYLAILNSKLMGYYFFLISTQWGKGEEKRATIRNTDIEKLPLFDFKFKIKEKTVLTRLVEQIESMHTISSKSEIESVEDQIDEIVFEMYNLLDYEKEIIREFYEINVERTGSRKYVNEKDLKNYIVNFSKTFELILAENYTIEGTYKISGNVGAVVCFSFVDQVEFADPKEDASLEIVHFVKSKQLQETEISKIMNEDKVKIYEEKFFYIIKSNLFKDWTKKQAIKDAKEEIGLLLSKLPETHEI